MKFLSARWEHLLLANYAVSPELLEPLVPPGTKLDLFENQCFVSLVAFLFNRTRVLGIPVPGHRNFEEVNLRFYVSPVHLPERRAVTFIKEIVPLAVIPLVANSLFQENYVCMKMDHRLQTNQIQYTWGRGPHYSISAYWPDQLTLPGQGSLAEFITEHYWGYARCGRGTLEYRVEHPQWQCCQLTEYELDVDFASLYGQQFAMLTNRKPESVLYARGSAVTVSFPKRLVVPT